MRARETRKREPMRDDSFYQYLLHECQDPDLDRRLAGLADLRGHRYVDLVEPQFLLDRLNSTPHWQEQRAIIGLMCEIEKPLPVDALMAILEDRETSSFYLRMEVAATLAYIHAEEALDLVLRLIQDEEEEIALREALVFTLPTWGEHVGNDLLRQLVADPTEPLCAAALHVWQHRAPETIPTVLILPYCTHTEPYMREEAIKALVATENPAAIEPVLAALADPEDEVRDAAAHGCITLVERFGEQIPLEPLLALLHDAYPSIRENIIDALGKAPERAPLEPVIAALSDELYYVRCAALETLGLMGDRVPTALYPRLQEMSGADETAQIRWRATRTLLMLHGIPVGPPKIPTIDLTLEESEQIRKRWGEEDNLSEG